MLRVCPTDGGHSTVLNVDAKSAQVVLHNPTTGGATAGHVTAQRHISPPKMFAFDAVFTPNDSLVRVLHFTCTDFHILSFLPRDGMLARYMLSSLSVCLSVCHKSEFYKDG